MSQGSNTEGACRFKHRICDQRVVRLISTRVEWSSEGVSLLPYGIDNKLVQDVGLFVSDSVRTGLGYASVVRELSNHRFARVSVATEGSDFSGQPDGSPSR